MEMTFNAEDEAFREEVRTFIAGNLPPEIRKRRAARPLCPEGIHTALA